MIDQTFSARNFLRLTTRLDPKKYKLGKNRADYLETLEKISQASLSDNFEFSTFSRSVIAEKFVYSVTNHIDEFVIRKLNDNVSRLYDVKQANRSEIIGQVIPLLKEKAPYFLLKLDVKSFYESIDRRTLLSRINEDSSLGYRSKSLLNKLLADASYFSGTGLPRGVSLSATLSEIYMKEFDTAARMIDGVYFYARFVDDILIFTYSDPSRVKADLCGNLPPNMFLNSAKEDLLGFNKNGNCSLHPPGVPELSYLGYRFIFRSQSAMPVGNLPKGAPPLPPRLIVKIADSKIRKMRRRIMLSIFSFFRDKDFHLLSARLRFLTGNCRMRRDEDNGRLLSGIYYNYSLIDEVAGVKDLEELTKFLRRAILSKRGGFGRKMQTLLSQEQRRELFSYSFEVGFREKITFNASPKRLKQIKACWRHV